jgi:hypothetical protein
MINIYILIVIRGANMLKQRPFCHLVWTYAELSSIMYEASFTQDSINNSQNSQKLLRTARNHRILHMPMEWMNEYFSESTVWCVW